MNLHRETIKNYQKRLIYKSSAMLTCIILIILCGTLLYKKNIKYDRKSFTLESKQSFAETQQNRMLFENSLIIKAEAMYNNLFLRNNFTVESYIADIKHLVQSAANYYGIFNPIKVTISYDNVIKDTTAIVPLDIMISMDNIFDYTPLRVVFILFNNTAGTIKCNGFAISRKYSGSVFEQVENKGYLFTSNVNLKWFVLLKPKKSSFKDTFIINYKKVKDLEKIELMYNMSTWDESFMVLPSELEKLKEIQYSMR
jgi:hypothetical protein